MAMAATPNGMERFLSAVATLAAATTAITAVARLMSAVAAGLCSKAAIAAGNRSDRVPVVVVVATHPPVAVAADMRLRAAVDVNKIIAKKSMKITTLGNTGWIAASLLVGGILLLASGCSCTPSSPPATTALQISGTPGQGQPLFASDEEAMNALLTAVKVQNHDQVHLLLGPAWKELVSGDKVEDANAFAEFAHRAGEHTRLQKQDDVTSIIYVGNDDWPFPIPLAKTSEGKWFFDTEAGKTEILARRIGENELNAIELCRAYVQAQREYASKNRAGNDVIQFAQKIRSTPGKMDGLYWDPIPGQEPSPFASLFASATTQGYVLAAKHPREPYRGYRFRVLKRQGAAAPGGKYDYVINGNMVAGFALVAFPADYEASGIMTFIVNQSGEVYQKDLGPQTTNLARHMTEYNPDRSWTLAKD